LRCFIESEKGDVLYWQYFNDGEAEQALEKDQKSFASKFYDWNIIAVMLSKASRKED
jgi:hypothetical protein